MSQVFKKIHIFSSVKKTNYQFSFKWYQIFIECVETNGNNIFNVLYIFLFLVLEKFDII